jgi:cytochrome c oxidase assembly protein subunit 15
VLVDLRSRVAAWTRPVLAPTPVSMRRLALAGVIADTVIMSTGAAVRLSASGLGCPDWPQCSAADVVASKNAGQTLLNTWIEFGNRLLNFPLVIIAALIFIAAWRFRPDGRRQRDLVWLGAAQPLGVVAQAVIGGIVVLTKLNPATVSVHFLVSAAVVAAAVALHMRCAQIASPQELGGRGGLGGTVSPQEQGGSGGDRPPGATLSRRTPGRRCGPRCRRGRPP